MPRLTWCEERRCLTFIIATQKALANVGSDQGFLPASDHRNPDLGYDHRDGALLELLAGMREPAGLETPPLESQAGGPLRLRELLTGVGRRV